MQSADDDTTAPPRPTEFNLQVRQLKLTKTGDAESFTVGAAAAIAAEKRRSPPNDTGKTIADMQKVELEWSIRASYYSSSMARTSWHLSTQRDILVGAQCLASQDCCKGPPGKPYTPLFPLMVGSRFYLPAGKPTRGLNTDTPDRTKLSLEVADEHAIVQQPPDPGAN
ncbi:hypothetical protein BO85DRAFT_466196 [Aspergillus piperis CBS 112811]|uniref:Uncharacterized protein n=1 Tax=Aspergillus piperis CBS 112811 TaxID=1448313 RepID=A0A8G1RC72_9EURO|nr:hypothetical protein BO85DRAFT_466196 [Aspergillus piperis CBS 112811]RAH62506.1 hypothetical protein BO85DRAFT_466196 [Aspergillus piperis CBS 112811]